MSALLLGVLSAVTAIVLQDGPAPAPKERLEALRREYQAAEVAWTQRYGEGQRGDPQAQLVARYRDWPGWDYLGRIVGIAEDQPDDPAARDALIWAGDFARQVGTADARFQDPLRRALALMTRPRLRDDRTLVEGCRWLFHYPSAWTEQHLRLLIDESGNREVRGLACLFLADLLENRRVAAFDPWFDQDHIPSFQAALRARLDPTYIAYIKTTDPKAVQDEIRQLYERIIREFGDVRRVPPLPGVAGKTLAELAKAQLADLERPDKGRPAPEIAGPDTAGKPFKLSDLRGKVVVLVFFAPWVDTPPKQVEAVRRMAEQHRDRPLAIVGVACEKDEARLREAMARGGITWRCWRDDGVAGPIAKSWGVGTLPTVFVIDAAGMVRLRDDHEPRLEETVGRLLKPRDEPPPR